jgi:hypothetical protein
VRQLLEHFKTHFNPLEASLYPVVQVVQEIESEQTSQLLMHSRQVLEGGNFVLSIEG